MEDHAFCEFTDRLFQESRDTNATMYRSEYPAEELADDIAIYHPLDFFHECTKLHRRLLSHLRDVKANQEPVSSPRALLEHLGRIGRVIKPAFIMHR